MKNITILLCMFLLACTSIKKQENISKTDDLYNVFKIDSMNSYYIIYATKKDSIYKIVSKKEKIYKCNIIKSGLSYKLKLHSMRDNPPTIGGVKIKPINYMDINCFQFDNETSICKEKGIYDLYFADNINGLCIINK
jgi:hypothetical protein